MMREQLVAIQNDYYEMLVVMKMDKKSIKSKLQKLETVAAKNEELGIVADTEKIKQEYENKLNHLNVDIAKVKKVILRLDKCLEILDPDIYEDITEEDEE